MNPLIESLKRLYDKKEISEERITLLINKLISKGTINENEKEYILGKEE